MDSVEMSHESQVVGRRHTANFRWTAVMTSFMLACLVDQAHIGLKTDKGFKSTAIGATARAVGTRFNLNVNDTHVLNRLRHAHPADAPYINKPIEDYEHMATVCGNDQATGSFARTGSQNSRSLGVPMETPSSPPTMEFDEQPQGLDDFDFTQSQPPAVDTPTSSTSKTTDTSKKSKRIRVQELEVMTKVATGLDKLASAVGVDKRETLSKRLYDEVMTLQPYYHKSDLGIAYDHLNAEHSLATGFINKGHELRCFWMDNFLRQSGHRDGL